MTPPSRVSAGIVAQVPTVFRPHVHGSTASQSPEKPTARVADRYVGPLADSASDYSTMEDVAKALGDERQLFGDGNAEYQDKNNRNEKFLKITMAILYIKKYLRSGDKKDADGAVDRIETWLKDPVLLQDRKVGTPARLSLINTLKRAPKGQGRDEGIKAMIDVLWKNHAVNTEVPALSAAPVVTFATDTGSFLAKFSDETLFGAKLVDYNKRRNDMGKGGYLPMTMAILEIKRYLRGEQPNVEVSCNRVVAWLNSDLLTDSTAHAARVQLLAALAEAPQRSDAWNEGVRRLLRALRANYGRQTATSPQPVASNPLSKSELPTEYTAFPKSDLNPDAAVGNRDSLDRRLNSLSQEAFKRGLRISDHDRSRIPHDRLKLTCLMTVNVAEGIITSVSYENIKLETGSMSNTELKACLDRMAATLRSNFRFESCKCKEIRLTIIV